MSWFETVILILSGVLVGFINTLAGGGTIITISLLMFLGLPATVANGTNRIAIMLQTAVAVFTFRKQKILDIKKGLILCIPSVIGSIAGSLTAANLNESIIEKVIAAVMFVMLFFIVYKPEKWVKSKQHLIEKPIKWYDHLAYLIIGFYGGFIHIGVGFFMIAALVLLSGYDLLRANALKNFLVMVYAPFSLIVFVIFGQVNWEYGLILSIGNVMGAFIASKFVMNWGANFVRYVIIVVILITIMHLLGVFDFKSLFGWVL
ncbi:MAG: sulfite exporter TauE/SafE family protein [Bacteroidales bacterium]|jgi:hypothetical protein|nr:sulfite exporter TauE/SafE family protein [Bacteroidales bacterium]